MEGEAERRSGGESSDPPQRLGRRRKETLTEENNRLTLLLQAMDNLPDCRRGAISICAGERWKRCEDAYLLWAAFRLKGSISAETEPA